MTIQEYQTAAARTIPAGIAVNWKQELLNCAVGLAGETGEVCDIIKKWQFQGHDLDRDALKKELGDVAWYLALGCTGAGLKLEEVLAANIEKLKKRYPHGFEADKSINRPEYTEDKTCGLLED